MDFGVNALGTLNVLEAARAHCPEAVFIFTSTNKLYGDTPNRLPLEELASRWEIETGHQYEMGIDETMSIDRTKHSLFSQQSGSGCPCPGIRPIFRDENRVLPMRMPDRPRARRAGSHFCLAYLMKCTPWRKKPYRVFGYQGKQVRDNIHARDLVSAFWEFFKAPRSAGAMQHGRQSAFRTVPCWRRSSCASG